MTFGHDDIRERLVEYLYEELEGPARAAFDAHLAGCTTCRAETEAAGRARAVARTVVRAELGEAVPLGLRARVLEAAATAARERAALAVRPGSSVATQAAPTRAAPPTGSAEGVPVRGRDAPAPHASRAWRPWMDWLRGRWTLPTFATVGALAAFLLVRGTIFREARRPLGEGPAERLAAPALSPAPGDARPPAGASDQPLDRDVVIPPAGGAGEARPRPEEGRHRDSVRGERNERVAPAAKSAVQGGPGPAVERQQAIGSLEGLGSDAPSRSASQAAKSASSGTLRSNGSTHAPGAAARKDGGKRDDLLGELGSRSTDERRSAHAKAPDPATGSAARRHAAGGGAALDVEPSAGQSPSSLGATGEPEAELRKGAAPSSRDDSARFAQPPPAPPRPARLAPSPAPSPSGPPAPAAASATGSVSKSYPAAPGRARSGAPAPAAEPARPASASAAPAASVPIREDHLLSAEKKAKSRSADKSEAAADEVDERTAAPAAAARSGDPAVALSERAARLLAARRFTEASAAYRDLLRRFPDHPSAPLWRARLAASDRAGGSDTSSVAAPPPPK